MFSCSVLSITVLKTMFDLMSLKDSFDVEFEPPDFVKGSFVFSEYISHYSNINVLLLVVSVEINSHRQITVSALR